ncbi:MAG: sporulation integral membrane protein YtvI [Clostridia bacterium]|nr:sporulation integral membrane protein YtvI [Clostridia bacterium]
MTVDNKKNFIINTVYIALIAVLFYFALKYLAVWLLPFVIGFICALVLQKPVAFLSQKTRIPRGIWALVLVATILTALFGSIAFLGYNLYDQLLQLVTRLTDELPSIRESLGSLVGRFSGWLNNLPEGIASGIRTSPASLIESIIEFLSGFVTTLAKGAIVSVPSLLLTSVISIVACCFITIDYYKITNFILCQFSVQTQKVLLKTKRVFMENILKMLRGYILIIFITFIELFIGFLILDIPYTATIAFLVAIVDIFPILGTGTVLIPWAVIDLCIGKTGTGVGLLIVYVLITVIRNIIEPKIIGVQVGLPAIVTLMAMYLGLNLFGIMGLWAVPILVIVLVKLQDEGMLHIWKTGTCVAPSIVKRERNWPQNGPKHRNKQKNNFPRKQPDEVSHLVRFYCLYLFRCISRSNNRICEKTIRNFHIQICEEVRIIFIWPGVVNKTVHNRGKIPHREILCFAHRIFQNLQSILGIDHTILGNIRKEGRIKSTIIKPVCLRVSFFFDGPLVIRIKKIRVPTHYRGCFYPTYKNCGLTVSVQSKV